ncbi:condensation domain-containing protein [Granulicella mallensis]|uniref:Phthiocerol/phthiodiolone dimycocerosyl transferase n=1 Tax=Granulicella mallensis (strain ATCC BAA-1857 / DSM 23137 / MP5ACTX8) TaxID=682795 RepID=G8NS11_GRAMM|nr:condensation domain-containing protein [Granulicella mallensis]AEU36219.1 condensation domain protein [Granulicella mallensis MP5ACTX8]
MNYETINRTTGAHPANRSAHADSKVEEAVDRAQSPSVVRELGSLERWFYLMNQNRSNHYSITAEVSGSTTPAMWREALNQLQLRHPLLNVFIAERERSQISFMRDDIQSIPLTVFERSTPQQWQGIAAQDLSEPFDASKAPLIRATLLHGNDRCEIMLSVHHSIADGMSVAFLLRDLVSAVAGKALETHLVPASQGDLFADPETMPAPSSGSAATPRPVSFQVVESFYPQVDAVQFTQQETQALIEAARRQDTTLHAGIAAAAVLAGRALSPVWRQDPVRVFSPINLRNMLGLQDDCVVALSAGITAMDPLPDDDLWALARTIKQELTPQQSPQGIAYGLGFFDMATANGADSAAVSSISAASIGFELMVSNLGRVPFQADFGDLTIEALWGPVINQGYEGEQTISAATVNGSLCLVHTSASPIESLLAASIKLLRDGCGSLPQGGE